MKVLGQYDSVKLDEDVEQCQSFVAQTKFGLQEDFFKKIKDKQNGSNRTVKSTEINVTFSL